MFYGRRTLLNLPGHHSTAAIVAEIDTDTQNSYNGGCEPILKISDCDRAVNIELDFTTIKDIDNTLHKLDVMIDALTELRKGARVVAKRQRTKLKKEGKNE